MIFMLIGIYFSYFCQICNFRKKICRSEKENLLNSKLNSNLSFKLETMKLWANKDLFFTQKNLSIIFSTSGDDICNDIIFQSKMHRQSTNPAKMMCLASFFINLLAFITTWHLLVVISDLRVFFNWLPQISSIDCIRCAISVDLLDTRLRIITQMLNKILTFVFHLFDCKSQEDKAKITTFIHWNIC